jgi:hypothetical protein
MQIVETNQAIAIENAEFALFRFITAPDKNG